MKASEEATKILNRDAISQKRMLDTAKFIIPSFLVLLVVAAVLVLIAEHICRSGVKHVSPDVFARECISGGNQTVQLSYLGEKDGMVFLSRRTASPLNRKTWRKEIWYTEASQVDPGHLQALRQTQEESYE